jgi:hypothetical protein
MNATLRLTVCIAALGVAGAGLKIGYPGGVGSFACDLWSLPRLRAAIQDELQREADLQERSTDSLGRVQAKHQLVTELIARRMTLLEAAIRFRALTEGAPESVKRCAGIRPESPCSDGQACRALIAYVKAELASEPQLAAAVEARLREELARNSRLLNAD